LPYFMSYHVSFSFSAFVSFLAIFQVLQCVCHIFHIFQFSHHNLDPKVCVSHFTRFSVFLAKFHVLSCEFHIFHIFQFCRPYSMSYSVFFSFSIIFSYHIPCPTVDISKFSTFLSFPRHISRPKVCISHLP
jgi:hypothetical protein